MMTDKLPVDSTLAVFRCGHVHVIEFDREMAPEEADEIAKYANFVVCTTCSRYDGDEIIWAGDDEV